MINFQLFWYFLLPLFLSAGLIFIIHYFDRSATWLASSGFAIGGFLLSCLILSTTFYVARGVKMHDNEIVNGQVTTKSRVEGSYIESYSCNCHTVSSGSGRSATSTTVCDTCYRDHYTVNWSCDSDIGYFTIKREDWLSRSVYKLPDPARYTMIMKGDPVSKKISYSNYIKAVPGSLFAPAPQPLKKQFAGKLPPYPINVYDFYHVDRVIPVGLKVPDLAAWNAKLSEALKTLGPQKQANAVVVLTNINNPEYATALQDAWQNGKKNDIILIIGAGSLAGPASWVRVLALTQDSIFQVKLRDDILALQKLDSSSVINALSAEAHTTFHRKRMHDFSYLTAEIDPPGWVMATACILILLAYLAIVFILFKSWMDVHPNSQAAKLFRIKKHSRNNYPY